MCEVECVSEINEKVLAAAGATEVRGGAGALTEERAVGDRPLRPATRRQRAARLREYLTLCSGGPGRGCIGRVRASVGAPPTARGEGSGTRAASATAKRGREGKGAAQVKAEACPERKEGHVEEPCNKD